MPKVLIAYEQREVHFANDIAFELLNLGVMSDVLDVSTMNDRNGMLENYDATVFILVPGPDHQKVGGLLPYMPGIIFVIYYENKPQFGFSTLGVRYFSNAIEPALFAEVVDSRIQSKEIAKERAEKVQKIEIKGAEFMKDAITELDERKKEAKKTGNMAVIGGFVMLIAAVATAVFYGLNAPVPVRGTSAFIIGTIVTNSIRGLVVVGLLVASSKYLFNVGRAWLTESLKNADRKHAIKFGEFYVGVFGADIKGEEMKGVFENWNISTTSTFAELNANDHDPKLIENAVSLVKSATELTKAATGKESKD